MSEPVGIETSIAVRLLIQTHDRYEEVSAWARGPRLALCGHALVETYSVLTRLPGDLRVEADAAAVLIRDRFERPLLLDGSGRRRRPTCLPQPASRVGRRRTR